MQSNFKQIMQLIRKDDVDKVTKLISNGLDPNFIDEDSGGKFKSNSHSK